MSDPAECNPYLLVSVGSLSDKVYMEKYSGPEEVRDAVKATALKMLTSTLKDCGDTPFNMSVRAQCDGCGGHKSIVSGMFNTASYRSLLARNPRYKKEILEANAQNFADETISTMHMQLMQAEIMKRIQSAYLDENLN